MRFDRRQFLNVGVAGVAGAVAVQAGCGGGGGGTGSGTGGASSATGGGSEATLTGAAAAMKIKVRGLCLLDYQKGAHILFVRMLNAANFGMPAHLARLAVDLTAIDTDATSLVPSAKDQEGTSLERWFFDLNGKYVSILEDTSPPDTDVEPSMPSEEKPTDGNWKSLKWLPNVKALSDNTAMNPNPSNFVCNIPLKHGFLQGDAPKGQVGKVVVWTVKRPDGTQLTKQSYSDTVLFTRQLGGRTPVITIGAGKVVLRPGASGEVVFENAAPPPAPPPGSPVTAGHVALYFKVVGAGFEPAFTPDPTTLPACSGCETDPVFCPPAWGSF